VGDITLIGGNLMVKSYKIEFDPSTGDALSATRKFLSDLLSTGEIDALMVPQELSSGKNVVQTLVKDPNKLEAANPFAFVMPINSAKLISKLTDQNPGKRLGLVIRNCELRAMNELIKLKQINNENLIVIGVDCLGTFSLPDYAKLCLDKSEITIEMVITKSVIPVRSVNIRSLKLRISQSVYLAWISIKNYLSLEIQKKVKKFWVNCHFKNSKHHQAEQWQ
jgi:coenzyme F420-reducing hydrogenase beta subunit